MDLLIVEPLEPEVVQWLDVRYRVRYAPRLALEPLALRRALYDVRAMIIPPSVAVDEAVLQAAPLMRAIGRLSSGAESIDLEACARAGIEVIRPEDASAQAEAEFSVGAMLQMLRRVPVVNAEGLLVGRELGGAAVGIVGMTPAARVLARLLAAFGSQTVGYDPGLHGSDRLWDDWGVRPLALRELIETSDAVCVLLGYSSRYRGLLGERYLASCKPYQVLVSLAHSNTFDERALAEALGSGRMAAAWFDSMEPGMLDNGRPMHGIVNLQITPRVASTTRESRLRSAWFVARRIDALLSGADTTPGEFTPGRRGAAVDPGGAAGSD